MGATDLTKGKVMIVGATGSIASVCSRLLAQAIKNVVLVSIEPEKLLELKRTIQRETPGAEVTIATKAGDLISDCDLIVTATSAFGQRVIDLTKCKPGAVICDVARPPDINPAEAALRPDVLVIESGEVLIPGDIDFGYDIGLPPKTSYACLAETALLAMDGRFEDYTLGPQHHDGPGQGDLQAVAQARLQAGGPALLWQVHHRRGHRRQARPRRPLPRRPRVLRQGPRRGRDASSRRSRSWPRASAPPRASTSAGSPSPPPSPGSAAGDRQLGQKRKKK